MSSRAPRGFSLLECMVSLSLLAVGIVGLMHLQVFGLYADQGARANVRAQELARELTTALLRLDPSDTLLAPNYTGAVPAGYAQPLDPSTSSHWSTYATSNSLPGVTPTASLERDPLDPAQPLYVRKWSVWQLANANTASAVKLVAVSVVYHEQHLPRSRAVILYAQVSNPGAAAVNAAAYR